MIFLFLELSNLSDSVDEENKNKFGSGLAERIHYSLVVWANGQRAIKKPRYNKRDKTLSKFWDDEDCFETSSKNFINEEINANASTSNADLKQDEVVLIVLRRWNKMFF